MERSDAWYEAREEERRDRYYEDPEPVRRYKYHCGGRSNWSGPCGASDCGSCRNGPAPWEEEEEDEERTSERSRLVIARKARRGILPGDCVRVTKGFTYIEDGPRTGYFRYERLVGYGPGHPDREGEGRWPRGHKYAAH